MLTACGGVTYKDVVSHAEAHLYYPGSRVVSREGGDEERGGLDTGRSPAVATTDLATDATMSQVYAWYEGQRVGLGEEFLTCVDACIQAICRNPRIHALVFEQYRRGLVRRFPYAVFYEAADERVTVYCVFHTSRDPEKWRRRLS